MHWYSKLPARWEREREIAKQFLEDVRAEVSAENGASISGNLPLVSTHGHQWDIFQIRIVYPKDFLQPGVVPSVYLDSHRDRWRNVPDAHIEEDWKLCLYVPGESGIDWLDWNSLLKLLACVRTFLAKERFFQRDLAMQTVTGTKARWPGEARSHGIEGVRESLHDRKRPIGRNDACPCGSGKKFKKCCESKL